MRIVFNIPNLGRGGMERQLVDVSSGLHARGHEVTLTVNKRVEAYSGEIAASGISTVVFGSSRRFDPKVYHDLATVCRAAHADVLVGVSFNSTFYCRLVAKRLGLVAVTAEHGTDRVAPKKQLVANRILSRWTDATIACADAQVDSLVAEYNQRSKIHVVHNGIDTNAFRPLADLRMSTRNSLALPENAPVVGIVAAHRQEKRHDRFLDLIAVVRRTLPAVVGIGFGGGSLLERNRELAAAKGLGESVRFVGPLDCMVGAYNACDVVVLLSDVESLPLSLLEAQACRRPVVVMRSGGIGEAFVDGVSGYGVGPGDVSTAAARVLDLLMDRKAADRMGEAGRQWVIENRSLDLMVDGYEQLLAQVLERRYDQSVL